MGIWIMTNCRRLLLGVGLMLCSPATSRGQSRGHVLAPEYAGHYSVVDLGQPLGPGAIAGLTFVDDDTLLIARGSHNLVMTSIYSVDIVRDAVTQEITGFAGTGTKFADAPNIDGGLAFHPSGVLFYTTGREHQIVQMKPGSNSPDKVISLDSDIPPGGGFVYPSVDGLQFVPAGFAGAGQLKVTRIGSGLWYGLELTPDGQGTFDVTRVQSGIPVESVVKGDPKQPVGFAYVDARSPVFDADSVLLANFSPSGLVSFEVDANGDPLPSTIRTFMIPDYIYRPWGMAVDPVTGSILFTGDYAASVVRLTGFLFGDSAADAGDWNDDGNVDGTDFLDWQRNLGRTGLDVPGDATFDDLVDEKDLLRWKANFGAPSTSVAETKANAAPEPGSFALLAGGIAGFLLVCRRPCHQVLPISLQPCRRGGIPLGVSRRRLFCTRRY
jgi:hypothetical protein